MTIEKDKFSNSDMSSPSQYKSRFTILIYYLSYIFSVKQNKKRLRKYFQKRNINFLFNTRRN